MAITICNFDRMVDDVSGQPIGVQLSESFARAWDGQHQAGQAMRGLAEMVAGPDRPGIVIINSLAGVSPSYSRPPLAGD